MLNLLQASECRPTDGTQAEECDARDVHCVAGRAVEHVVCTAEHLLASDPGRYFLYKRPVPRTDEDDEEEERQQQQLQLQQQQQYEHQHATTTTVTDLPHYPPKGDAEHHDGYTSTSSSSSSTSSAAVAAAATAVTITPVATVGSFRFSDTSSGDSSSTDALSIATERRMHDHYEWPTIGDFQYNEAMNIIRDYIGLWRLTPATLYEMIVPDVASMAVPPLGVRHFVEAHFSKPTAMCPNPLAVAKVHFQMHVSHLLPRDYPIMVTYRFEGYRQVHYALGERCLRSMRYQRFYIDAIIATKLAFYAEICELRHPPHERQLSHSQMMLLRRKTSSRQTQQQRSFMMASFDMDMTWLGPTAAAWGIDYGDMADDYD